MIRKKEIEGGEEREIDARRRKIPICFSLKQREPKEAATECAKKWNERKKIDVDGKEGRNGKIPFVKF